MPDRRLREVKGDVPLLPRRKCGHPAGWTFDLTLMYKDGTGKITSYCAGCVMEKLGLKPVAQHQIIFDKEHPKGQLIKLWEED